MAVIMGIDPGSRITGYGLIHRKGNQLIYLDSGCIRTEKASTLSEKLHLIYQGIESVVTQYRPDEVGVEQVFMSRNADSALKLGQARGVAMVACAQQGVSVFEYSARQVKQSVVGTGAADKVQVQSMICRLLALSKTPQADAADALAVAVCHAHMSQGLVKILSSAKLRRGRLRHQSL